jgi:thiamine biosynthesis lipoprotein
MMVEQGTCHVFGFDAMGGPCTIGLASSPGQFTDSYLAHAAQHAIAEVARIEAKFSRYRPDSVVGAINAAAGGNVVPVDAETASLLEFANQLFDMSGGLFDITSGVLRQAWDFRHKRIPSDEVLQRLIGLVGWQLVERDGGGVRLPRAGMELDFGGFGKEYAADRAAAALHSVGMRHGYVNLGGDIRILGPQVDGSPWSFGIQHPRSGQEVLASIALASGALATSGDYERYFDLEGRRYCHVLDPASGWPVSHWQSVSVGAPVCSAAGALCTIVMLMQERGAEFIAGQDVGYLAVDHTGFIHSRNFLNASKT